MKCLLLLLIFGFIIAVVRSNPLQYQQYGTYRPNQTTYGANSAYAPYGSSLPSNPAGNQPAGQWPQTYSSGTQNANQWGAYNQTRPGAQNQFGSSTSYSPYGQGGTLPSGSYPHQSQGGVAGSNQWGQNRPGSVGSTSPQSGTAWNQSGTSTSGHAYPQYDNQWNQTRPASYGSNYPSQGPQWNQNRPGSVGSTYPQFGNQWNTTRSDPYPQYSNQWNRTAPGYTNSYHPPTGNPWNQTSVGVPHTSGNLYPNLQSRFVTPINRDTQEFLNCMRNCNRSYDYNPVCGTDHQTYPNYDTVKCEKQCGMNVVVLHSGACRT